MTQPVYSFECNLCDFKYATFGLEDLNITVKSHFKMHEHKEMKEKGFIVK